MSSLPALDQVSLELVSHGAAALDVCDAALLLRPVRSQLVVVDLGNRVIHLLSLLNFLVESLHLVHLDLPLGLVPTLLGIQGRLGRQGLVTE